MARRGVGGRGSGRSASIGTALKALVEAVAARVLERAERRLPSRQQVTRLERQVARLSRRIETGGGRVVVRRVGRPRTDRKCKMTGCDLPHVAQGFCSKHYQAWRRKKLRAAARSARRQNA
jgi:hypothetical protein